MNAETTFIQLDHKLIISCEEMTSNGNVIGHRLVIRVLKDDATVMIVMPNFGNTMSFFRNMEVFKQVIQEQRW